MRLFYPKKKFTEEEVKKELKHHPLWDMSKTNSGYYLHPNKSRLKVALKENRLGNHGFLREQGVKPCFKLNSRRLHNGRKTF
jgi:hypothetical protein